MGCCVGSTSAPCSAAANDSDPAFVAKHGALANNNRGKADVDAAAPYRSVSVGLGSPRRSLVACAGGECANASAAAAALEAEAAQAAAAPPVGTSVLLISRAAAAEDARGGSGGGAFATVSVSPRSAGGAWPAIAVRHIEEESSLKTMRSENSITSADIVLANFARSTTLDEHPQQLASGLLVGCSASGVSSESVGAGGRGSQQRWSHVSGSTDGGNTPEPRSPATGAPSSSVRSWPTHQSRIRAVLASPASCLPHTHDESS